MRHPSHGHGHGHARIDGLRQTGVRESESESESMCDCESSWGSGVLCFQWHGACDRVPNRMEVQG